MVVVVVWFRFMGLFLAVARGRPMPAHCPLPWIGSIDPHSQSTTPKTNLEQQQRLAALSMSL